MPSAALIPAPDAFSKYWYCSKVAMTPSEEGKARSSTTAPVLEFELSVNCKKPSLPLPRLVGESCVFVQPPRFEPPAGAVDSFTAAVRHASPSLTQRASDTAASAKDSVDRVDPVAGGWSAFAAGSGLNSPATPAATATAVAAANIVSRRRDEAPGEAITLKKTPDINKKRHTHGSPGGHAPKDDDVPSCKDTEFVRTLKSRADLPPLWAAGDTPAQCEAAQRSPLPLGEREGAERRFFVGGTKKTSQTNLRPAWCAGSDQLPLTRNAQFLAGLAGRAGTAVVTAQSGSA